MLKTTSPKVTAGEPKPSPAKIEPSSNGTVINQLTKKLVQSQSEYATYSRQGNILHLPELEKQICEKKLGQVMKQ